MNHRERTSLAEVVSLIRSVFLIIASACEITRNFIYFLLIASSIMQMDVLPLPGTDSQGIESVVIHLLVGRTHNSLDMGMEHKSLKMNGMKPHPQSHPELKNSAKPKGTPRYQRGFQLSQPLI